MLRLSRARAVACFVSMLLTLGFALLWQQRPLEVAAHAALERSEPAAGAALPQAPPAIRLWFTEPLEATYTRADLLDASGNSVSGISSAIAPDRPRELVLTPPAALPDGQYTVAWRTLSAADGHTLQGYFGFAIGVAGGNPAAATMASDTTLETWRGFSRGLALIGLALVLAIAPVTLFVLDPGLGPWPEVAAVVARRLRRFVFVAAFFAIGANTAALALQAVAILPGDPLFAALAGTLPTRYGTLWLARMALLLVVIAALLVGMRGERGSRTVWLGVAAIVGIAAPVPFSLLSHAAALEAGRMVAVAADALHLLLAAIWGGGLVLLGVILVPTLIAARGVPRHAIEREIVPRFSAIALAAWGVLVLTGLYASWLQVGSREALTDTPYGRSLLLKVALLVPVLALGAYHLRLGRTAARADASERLDRTLVAEAILVLAVLLVVGRLIGQEPARAVLASQTPGSLVAAVTFATEDGPHGGELTISPGAAGANTFVIDLPGAALPEGSEAVLRFALPDRDIGAQELRLTREGDHRFRGAGTELALPGDWQIEAVVRKIGAFSWPASVVLAIDATPPALPPVNPAPRFAPSGVLALVLIALGFASLAGVIALPRVRPSRLVTAATGLALIGAGFVWLGSARLLPSSPEPAVAAVATPAAMAVSTEAMPAHLDHAMGTPTSDLTAAPLPAPGTPVVSGDLTMRLLAVPAQAGTARIRVAITDADGLPVTGARVAVIAQMAGMETARSETVAAEIAPGMYEAAEAPLTMSGTWQIAVRASPRGQPSATARWTIEAP